MQQVPVCSACAFSRYMHRSNLAWENASSIIFILKNSFFFGYGVEEGQIKKWFESGGTVYVYEDLVQTHLPFLSNFTAPPPV
jgi:hypothetical protein